MNDSAKEEIQSYFEETSAWLDSALRGGESRVLVSCWQGASRSATVVLAYILTYTHLTLTEAVTMVRQRRDIREDFRVKIRKIYSSIEIVLNIFFEIFPQT